MIVDIRACPVVGRYFSLGDKRRQWRFMAPSATAAAFHCRAGHGGCRRSGRIARSPPSGGRDAANNSCLPSRAGRGGRRRSGRTARPPPSGGRGAAIFLSPTPRPPAFFLDVERPFLPLSRSFFSALGELFFLFFNTKWRSVLIFITCLIVDIHSGAFFSSRGGSSSKTI